MHTNALFTPEELNALNTSMRKREAGASLYRTPSRLQQIKSQHIKPTANPLARDVEPEEPLFVPTDPSNPTRALDRADSFISIRNESEDDSNSTTLRSNHSRGSGVTSHSLTDDLTIGELRSQVWIYVHETKGVDDGHRATEFMGDIDDGHVMPLVSRGRRRVLTAIRSTPHSESPQIWPQTAEPEVLTDKNYCARRLHDYIDRKGLLQPGFLERRILRERQHAIDRRYRASRQRMPKR
jgi:hypothetical protein